MLTNEINFKKLSVLLMFMQERSIGRTADKLNMSAVSVHRALHSLEDALGIPLFTNKGRNLIPLASAEMLVQPSRQAINVFQAGLSAVRETTGKGNKVLRIGAICSLIPYVLPTLLERLKVHKRALAVEVVSGSNSMLTQYLNDEDIDAALLGTPYPNAGRTRQVVLFSDEIYFACLPSSRFAALKSIELTDCIDEKFVSLSSGFVTAIVCEELFRMAAFEPNVVGIAHDIFSLIHFVAQGFGHTLLPKRMEGICKAHGVMLVPLEEKYRISQDIVLVYKSNRKKDRNLHLFAGECRRYASLSG